MDKVELNNIHRVLVLGLGYRTGLSACNFLAGRGMQVTVSDMKGKDELTEIMRSLDPAVRVVSGAQDPSILDGGYDLVVLSPGVPARIPLVARAVSLGLPVISEVELASYFLKGRLIAITGTDGKSTTTALTGHICKELGLETFVGGNIGVPLISFAEKTRDASVTVAELSSFQLETIKDFRPDVSAILNLSPDHLDRYDGMESYFQAKLRITANQKRDDFFIYNLDDSVVSCGIDGVAAMRRSFSLVSESADAFYRDGTVYVRSGSGEEPALETERLRIMGLHNVQNFMAALLMVRSVLEKSGIKRSSREVADAATTFPGLEHRLEGLGQFQGRAFINDSKATTVGAVETAVRSLAGSGVLILGGRTKGDDYSRLAGVINGKIRALVLIGESRDEFSRIFSRFRQASAATLDDAVIEAMKLSEEGDTIILSPACASFDMFENYEERGSEFRKSVERLKEGKLTWI